MSEPRIDWGLVVASRLTFVPHGERQAARPRSRKAPVRSDAELLGSMIEGGGADDLAGRRVLSSIINRLIIATVLGCGLLIVAVRAAEHDSGAVFRVVKAIPATAMVFCGSLAILMQRRWYQMGRTRVFPRRRSNILLPAVLGALTFLLYLIA